MDHDDSFDNNVPSGPQLNGQQFCCNLLEKLEKYNQCKFLWMAVDSSLEHDHYRCLRRFIEMGVSADGTYRNCTDIELYKRLRTGVQIKKTLQCVYARFGGCAPQRDLITQAMKYDNNLKCVHVLLEEAKANPDQTDADGKTPLMYAMDQHNYERMNILIAFGSNINIQDQIGRSALSYGADAACPTCIQKLIRKGASVNFFDIHGRNALMYAAATNIKHSGWAEKIKIIIDAGALLNEKDHQGYTALMWAAKSGNETHMEALLQAGAETHHKTKNGNTLLHCAAMSRNFDCIRMTLADATTKVKVLNDDGLSALDVHFVTQEKKPHPRIIDFLFCAGDSVKTQYRDKIPKLHEWSACESRLDELCLKLIRSSLLNINQQDSMFFKVQQLQQLPCRLKEKVVGIYDCLSTLDIQ